MEDNLIDNLIDNSYWLFDEARELMTTIENIKDNQVLDNKQCEEIKISCKNIEELQKKIMMEIINKK